MCAELVMRKRRAREGEVGLFADFPEFSEAFATIKLDVDVKVDAKTETHARYLRLSWHIANLICQGSDEHEYPDDAREWLLIHAKHSRKVMDKLRGKAELKAKGTRHLDGTAWLALIPRLVHVATTMYGIPEDAIFTDLSREEFFRRDDPPPVTEIPDGPGMGHNSTPAGVSPDLDKPERPAEPARERPRPTASEAPPAREATQRPRPGPETPGDPSEVPKVPTQYPAYAKWHIDLAADHKEAMGWLWTPEQAKLRDQLLIPIGVRKQLERYCADKFGGAS